MRVGLALAVAFVLGLSHPAAADEAARTLAASTLATGNLAQGADGLAAMIAADPANDDAKLGLGMVQFMQAVEGLSQGLYRYGLQPPRSFLIPIMRLPVPVNPRPQTIDFDKFRALLLTFVDDLAVADETLAGVASAGVKVPVNLAALHYDADGDGKPESFNTVLAAILDLDVEDFDGAEAVVAFDTADAYWFRGYSNVLMGLGEFLLAYDWRDNFDVSFHVFFPRAQSAFQQALALRDPRGMFTSEVDIADIVSFIHIRWPVGEGERMAKAREHLKTMVAMSRSSWEAIVAETDNDREWIPSPDQVSYMGTEVRADQIVAWMEVLDEVEALLDGTKLMPHWRFNKGVNMRRVFDEPTPFDLILWITGPSAFPYLEDGPVLTSRRWNDIIRAFDGQFGSYAIWFN